MDSIEDLLNQAEEGYLIPCRDDCGVINLFARSACGDTLLHVAVGRCDIEEIKYLVGRGLDINARGDFLQTPLYLAASKGDQHLFDALVAMGADSNVPDHLGVLPIDVLKRRQPISGSTAIGITIR